MKEINEMLALIDILKIINTIFYYFYHIVLSIILSFLFIAKTQY